MMRASGAARAAAALVGAGLLLGVWGGTAGADQRDGLTLTLATRWRLAATAGAWSTYVVTVRNDAATRFDGVVVLSPVETRNTPFSADTFPRYRSAVSVPAGGQRTLQISVVEASGGYRAELLDGQGRQAASADLDLSSRSSTAVAVLSDVTSADQRIGVPVRSLSRLDVAITRFASPQAFPASAIELIGLNGVILDQFDTGALSQAQLQALRDFVGLGGTLIEVGGASWRRTLLPLPAELVPMRPGGTSTASLGPLAELGGQASDAAVQVATGDLASTARVAVAAPGGPPLVVESVYGAGSIVELAFDPLAPPVDGRVDLAALLWSQAIARGLSATQGSSQLSRLGVGRVAPGGDVLAGSGPGTWTAFPGFLYQVLNDLPMAASPPFGLLVVLLVVYILLVSAGGYALLKALGRRGLLWALVPAVALTATAGAYLVGFGTRGSDYQQTQVQFQRLGPGGVAETYSYDGVLAPRRGDMRVTPSAGALVSSAILVFGPGPNGGRDTTIAVGPRPEVRFPNVPVWDMRPVQTLSIGHPFGAAAGPGMPVDARLRLEGGRIKGELVNHTGRTLRDLQLVSATGMQATLASALAPGAAAAVDAAPGQGAPGIPMGKMAVGIGAVAVGPGMQPPQTGRQALAALAASEAAGRGGELALIGLTDPVETLRVEGERPLRSGPAMVVEPVRLRSATTLGQLGPAPNLVSSYPSADGSIVDVYELVLPPGLTGRLGLDPVYAGGVQQTPTAVEIYDWSHGTWRRPPAAPAGQPGVVRLAPDETGQGAVRIRVRESSVGLVQMALVDLP